MADNMDYRIASVADAARFIPIIKERVIKGLGRGPVIITLGREKRSISQNAKLWPMLTDVSKQVIWYGEALTSDEWKQMLTASLRKQKTIPGTDGGFVVVGMSTSKMDKETFSMLIEVIYAFGSNHGVKWSEKAKATYEKYRENE